MRGGRGGWGVWMRFPDREVAVWSFFCLHLLVFSRTDGHSVLPKIQPHLPLQMALCPLQGNNFLSPPLPYLSDLRAALREVSPKICHPRHPRHRLHDESIVQLGYLWVGRVNLSTPAV